MPREVQLRLVANFREALGEDSAVASFSIGPTGEAMVLAVANADAREPFVEETRADRTYDGTVLIHSGGRIERIDCYGKNTKGGEERIGQSRIESHPTMPPIDALKQPVSSPRVKCVGIARIDG